ncbi:hypothetical protein D3C87_1277530 [compost metagenome]
MILRAQKKLKIKANGIARVVAKKAIKIVSMIFKIARGSRLQFGSSIPWNNRIAPENPCWSKISTNENSVLMDATINAATNVIRNCQAQKVRYQGGLPCDTVGPKRTSPQVRIFFRLRIKLSPALTNTKKSKNHKL